MKIKERKEVKIFIILALLLTLGLSQTPQQYNEQLENLTTKSTDLSEESHCFEEGGEWYCYTIDTNTGINLRFTENIMCYADEGEVECLNNTQIDCKDRLTTYCQGKVKPQKETQVTVHLRKPQPDGEIHHIYRNRTLGEDKEIQTLILPSQINYEKCKAKENIFIHHLNCSYKDETYITNMSFIEEEVITISGMDKPEKGYIKTPSLNLSVTIILLIIVIATSIWVFYPKVKKMKRGNKNE